MSELALPMAQALLSWLCFFLAFSGLGLAAQLAGGKRLASGWHWLDAFWLGWAVSLAFMQVWHFFLPVNDALLLLLVAVAGAQLLRQRGEVWRILRRLGRHKLFVALFGLLCLWLSNRALGMPIAYDTGLRDLQAVAWMDSFPLAPGLGNLFSSLAYNHSSYLYDALLDAGIWSGRSVYIATGLLIAIYLAYALAGAIRVFRSRSPAGLRWSWICAALTLPYILHYTVREGGITHFLTDTVVDLLGFLTLCYLLDFLQCWRAGGKHSDYLALRLAIVILAGLTVKQTYIVYGLATAALSGGVWWRRGGFRLPKAQIAKLALPLMGLALLLPGAWLARGVVTSGYLAFPQPFGRFELDWTMAEAQIAYRQRFLASSTRAQQADRADGEAAGAWIGPWLEDISRSMFAVALPCGLALGGLAVYLAARFRNRAARQAPSPGWIALAPLAIMLLFWFLTAPDDKYARYVFWGLAAMSLTLALLAESAIAWRRRLRAYFAIVALCLAYIGFLLAQRDSLFLSAAPGDGFHEHFLPVYIEYETRSGLIVHVPRDGNQCWHVPLPCTPFPDPALSARVPGDIRHGFRIEGAENES